MTPVYETLKSRMPPPLPCLIGVLAGVVCHWLRPWPVGPYGYALTVGVVLLSVMVILVVSVSQAFRRHETPASPRKETTALIESGPFGRSRNPVYVAVLILQAALGFLLNNAWVLVAVVPAMVAIHYLVVLREEAYLEARFGEAYLRYKSRVRRWL